MKKTQLLGTLAIKSNLVDILLLKVIIMKKLPITLLSLIFTALTTAATPQANLIMGTIQFPNNVHKIPTPRIYYGGHIVLREAHNESKTVTFSIPKNKYTNSFYLLITESIGCQTRQDNIIDYLKISPDKKHKLYGIRLLENYNPNDNQETEYSWDVIETRIDHSGRIPDNTIIICLPAKYIDKVTGGNAFELPTIKIKQNIIDLAGSEEKFNEASIALLLASLDSDTIHTPVEQAVKHVNKHTLIAQKS